AVGDGQRDVREREHLPSVPFDVVALGQVLDEQLASPGHFLNARPAFRAASAAMSPPNRSVKNPSFTRRSTTLLSITVLKSNDLRVSERRGSTCWETIALTAPSRTYGTRSKMLPFWYRS